MIPPLLRAHDAHLNRKNFGHKHFLGTKDLTKNDIDILLNIAGYYADTIDGRHYQPDLLEGKIILSLFYEDSTRTRTSFELAAKLLGAQWINIDIAHSSVKKGESLLDTVLTLDTMIKPDAIIVRHKEYGAPDFIAQHVRCPVINAGDSWREHPTQALLDALTIIRNKGSVAGQTIAICGDIAHSRVAASNMDMLTKLGAHVRVIAPPLLMPQTLPYDGIEQYISMEEGLPGCDIVMMLRLQKERMDEADIPSEESFFADYGLTLERLALAKQDALVMHPGPINRNVEIADEVADDPKRSLILQQVRNGVPARMAVFDLLINKSSGE